jgi:hypothetical protein
VLDHAHICGWLSTLRAPHAPARRFPASQKDEQRRCGESQHQCRCNADAAADDGRQIGNPDLCARRISAAQDGVRRDSRGS